MQIQQSQKSQKSKSAQDFLAIDTVHDGIIVLKSGGLRAVLMTSSFNFALKSVEEQEAIIYQYQNFLNSLDFSVQFVVHSRRLNIMPYLESLKERSKEETSDLLKIQIDEYIEFVRSFVELSNIVSKTFYVIVPFDPSVAKMTGVGDNIFSIFSRFGKKGSSETVDVETQFEEFKSQLQQRIDQVALALIRFGVRTVQLNTEEAIELLYGLYNPGEIDKKSLPATAG